MDQSLLDLLPQIHALFSDPLRVVMMGSAPALNSPFDLVARGLAVSWIPTVWGVVDDTDWILLVLLLILACLGRWI